MNITLTAFAVLGMAVMLVLMWMVVDELVSTTRNAIWMLRQLKARNPPVKITFKVIWAVWAVSFNCEELIFKDGSYYRSPDDYRIGPERDES